MTEKINYRRSFSNSLGSGMKSVFGSNGRRFYELEFRTGSGEHRAGESQKIIVDRVELGRGHECAVHFGSDLTTVSRRHAAIVKEGDGWKLIHLSTTNSTYVNGHDISESGGEWYLTNGDEIQLASNGPRLGFIVREGAKSFVSSIGLSARLSLFRKQALRPYRRALTALSCVLVLVAAVGTYMIVRQGDIIDKQQYTIAQLDQKMIEADSLRRVHDDSLSRAINAEISRNRNLIAIKNRKIDSLINSMGGGSWVDIIEREGVSNDIYLFGPTKIFATDGSREEVFHDYGWSGTGFLLDDGRFVTARHCVEGWLFGCPTVILPYVIAAASGIIEIKAEYAAINKNHDILTFTSDDFIIDRSMDKIVQVGTSESGEPLKIRYPYPDDPSWNRKMWSADHAATRPLSRRGRLHADAALSTSLPAMQKMCVVGFPKGLGVENTAITPIYNEVINARTGLDEGDCILHGEGTDHGNSGGPVLTINNEGNLVVIGIVSRGDTASDQYNHAVPISKIN